jgi:hypothetical protein
MFLDVVKLSCGGDDAIGEAGGSIGIGPVALDQLVQFVVVERDARGLF